MSKGFTETVKESIRAAIGDALRGRTVLGADGSEWTIQRVRFDAGGVAVLLTHANGHPTTWATLTDGV